MMSGGFSKPPPFLLAGLLMVILILGFNYYRASRLNGELLQKLNINLGNHDKELTKLRSELSDITNAKELLAATHTHLEEEHKNTRIELSRAQEQASKDRNAADEQRNQLERQLSEKQDEIRRKNEELTHNNEEIEQLRTQKDVELMAINKTLSVVQNDKIILLTFIGDQLGREGIETILSANNINPEPYRLPSFENVPQCKRKYYEQAKAEFAAQQANAAKNVEDKAAIINSPNMEKVLSDQKAEEQGDQANSSNKNLIDLANQDNQANGDGIGNGVQHQVNGDGKAREDGLSNGYNDPRPVNNEGGNANSELVGENSENPAGALDIAGKVENTEDKERERQDGTTEDVLDNHDKSADNPEPQSVEEGATTLDRLGDERFEETETTLSGVEDENKGLPARKDFLDVKDDEDGIM